MSLTRVLVLFALCVAVVMVHVSAIRPPPRVRRPFETKHHSLSQACHGVLEERCPPGSASRLECLEESFNENDSHECRLWVGWRTLCNAIVKVKLVPNGKCNFTAEESTPELVRECLREVDKRELPAACYDNPYFKSLTLHAPRRMDDDSDL